MPRSKKEKSIDGPTKSKGSKEISLKEDKDFTVHHIEDEELEDGQRYKLIAKPNEQEEERRIPAIFIIGVVLGIVMTYILLTF
ncbi:hypothetical protein ACFLZH_01875 [Patescibacteria group bacterium]